ncbi:MAG: hypothetical protein Q9219_003075 [cf. Caloplaca sp. 3 TL-2023]
MDLTLEIFDTYSTSTSATRSRRRSSVIPGISIHSAIHATTETTFQDTLLSFLSYIKTQNIPILPVTKPDIRTVLGQGASFLVNGVELPRDYVDPATGTLFPQGEVLAFKRAILGRDMSDPISDRIRVIFNELLTTCHPPLRSHPNIVKLHGIAFETEGPADALNAMPVLVPECAELGNLAEVLETARKEDRAIAFHDKLLLCVDIAHGLEILHACDIVHGDVKCENVLVFEKEDPDQRDVDGMPCMILAKDRTLNPFLGSDLQCKLTDFGVSRHPDGGVSLGGSRPWQAPECTRGAYFRIEAAKRTDIFSFGMLLWRVMFDGDPFKHLEGSNALEAKNDKDKRNKRNEAVAALKKNDRLVHHVYESLAVSEKFDRYQIEMLSEVMSITLALDPLRRELDLGRIIRLLTPNHWYESRHVLPPARLPTDVDAQLLDLEKWYSEFESASPVVQKYVAEGFRDNAMDIDARGDPSQEGKVSAAAFQLAVCYANGFGVPFSPDDCLKWCRIAAERGSPKAREALPKVAAAFDLDLKDFISISAAEDDSYSMLSSSVTSEQLSKEEYVHVDDRLHVAFKQHSLTSKPTKSTWTLLKAAEACEYGVLESLLSGGAKPNVSKDGVSPLHFLSSWNLVKAERIGRQLIEAGADINARAERGSTVGK